MATGLLLSLLAMKQVASNIEGEVGRQFTGAVGSAIAGFVDEYCGTPSGPPRPHQVLSLAADLAVFANSLPQSSSVRNDALGLASQLAQAALTSN